MTDPAKRLAEAERAALVARERLSATISTLQAKLDPRTLARTTATEIADRGSAAAKAGVSSMRRNPVLLAGVAVVTALLFARRPVAAAVGRGRKIFRKSGKRPHNQRTNHG